MLFARRKPPTWTETLRLALWPRRSFGRSVRYLGKRVLRLRATPHAIALGVAVGVFVSFLPIPGFHLVVAAFVAWLVSGNIVAATIGTAIGNPLTFPFIWGATYEIGHFMIHGDTSGAERMPDLLTLFHQLHLSELWRPLLEPMLVGSIPLGLAFATLAYIGARKGVSAFQRRRLERFDQRHPRRAGDLSADAKP